MGPKALFHKFTLTSHLRYLLGIFDAALKYYWIKSIAFVGKNTPMNSLWWHFFGPVFLIGDIRTTPTVSPCHSSKVLMKEENARISKAMNMITHQYWLSRDSKNSNIKSATHFYICTILLDLITPLEMLKSRIWTTWTGWLSSQMTSPML